MADGRPEDVLTEANLRTIFGVRARLVDTPEGPVFQLLERVA
jgi:ABC-type cobalamin/Fe3+-siderophores transport system ATPase subunit